jgi:nucleoid-associated protein YgaU
VLAFQLVSLRGRYNDAQLTMAEMRSDQTSEQAQQGFRITELETTLAERAVELADLRRILRENDLDPDAPSADMGRPGTEIGTGSPAQPTQEWPITHVIASGENISTIARRVYGNADQATLEHIRATNNIANIHNVPAGLTLTLVPME